MLTVVQWFSVSVDPVFANPESASHAPRPVSIGQQHEELATSPPGPPTLLAARADLGQRTALLRSVQRLAGNRAAATLVRRTVQRSSAGKCDSCAKAEEEASDEANITQPLQRLDFGFLDSLFGDLAGPDEAEELQGKPGAACTEQPTITDSSPVPTTITADSAVEFVQKAANALGNPHMQPSFSWAPEVDEKDRITKINLKLTTKIIRPRWGGGRLNTGGRDPDNERALIKRAEDLIDAHEKRHRAIAQEFAQKAVCAVIGKPGDSYEKALKKVMCDMNKAQEALDGKEGMISFKLDAAGTTVLDVSLSGTAQSYPCQ